MESGTKLQSLLMFEAHLRAEEKSRNTVEKYVRNARAFMRYAAGRPMEKGLVMEYKAFLAMGRKPASANSMLASLNAFLRFTGRPDCCVKPYKVQRQTYCPEEKELTRAEYARLVGAAKSRGNERLCLLLQTICGTGIRVSELASVTVEAARRGEAVVNCKGKVRTIFLVAGLRRKLLQYAAKNGIASGAIFITRRGKPIHRCSVWREMKALCGQAGVRPAKVFPHNLRHLFARTFYHMEKDIAKLADILGHSSIQTTRIYIVSTGAEHRRQMERMRLIL